MLLTYWSNTAKERLEQGLDLLIEKTKKEKPEEVNAEPWKPTELRFLECLKFSVSHWREIEGESVERPTKPPGLLLSFDEEDRRIMIEALKKYKDTHNNERKTRLEFEFLKSVV